MGNWIFGISYAYIIPPNYRYTSKRVYASVKFYMLIYSEVVMRSLVKKYIYANPWKYNAKNEK